MSLENAQITLQNALTTTFLTNLAFLSDYDNILYQRIEGLSQAINSGAFKENYSLEFLQDNGDFDIYDHNKKSYIYNKNPRKYNRTAYNKVDFTSKGSVSILDPQIFTGEKFTAVFDEVEYFCSYIYSNKILINDLFEYTEVFNNSIDDFNSKKYKYINKFMFIGTLSGRHIPLILEKTKAKNFFVCEPNLEIFRLSLFVVDYADLARSGNTVIFSIMDDPHILDYKLDMFLANKAYENYSIKFFTTDYNIEEYFNHILNSILAHKSTSFNHHMSIENIWKNVTERINKYPILQLNSPSEDELTNTPVLFLAAGPSLLENINWIKENKDKFIVVAIAAAYSTLSKHGIIPDIITTLDPQYAILNKIHFNEASVQQLQDSVILASINTDERILNKLNKDNLFLYEVVKALHSSNTTAKGYSVGEISATILIKLQFKNIYFLGLDFSLNQTTGDTHTKGYAYSSAYGDDFKSKIHKERSNTFSTKKELIKIPGNLEKEVYTTRLFAMSANALSSNINEFKKESQTIYNLSSHGALFQGTIPKNIEEVQLSISLDKSILKKQLHTFLHTMSKNKLSYSDQENLQKELVYLKEIAQTLCELEKTSSNNFEEFNKKIEHLIQVFLFTSVYCSFRILVFIHFFNLVLQYIYYCLNTQNLKKEKEKIEKIEKIFLNQLKVILEKYTFYLNQI